MNVQEFLLMLNNPLVVARIQEILREGSGVDQATMVFSAPSSRQEETDPSQLAQCRRQIEKLSRALEESREEILRLQQENDTLKGQLEQANHSIQEFLQSSF